MTSKPTHYLKLAVLGDKQVGKTSLVGRYTLDNFNPIYLHTKGGDITEKVIEQEKRRLHVKIIDSAGHLYQRSLIKTLYRDVHGVMLVYDVTRRKTFEALDKWMHEISLVNTSNPFMLIVGNKADLSRFTQVPADEADMYAQRRDVDHIECSAKTSINVAAAFDKLLERTIYRTLPTDAPADTIKVGSETETHSSCCGGS